LYDIQGINWKYNLLYFRNTSTPITKNIFRQIRNKSFKNYKDLRWNAKNIEKDITPVRKDGKFYKFHYSRLDTNSTIYHFQLRNLLACPTKNDLYYYAQDSIRHYSPITHEFESIFNLDNSSWNNVFSLTASKNLVAIGIGDGNYILCDVNRPSHQKIKALPRVNSTDPQAASVDYTINYLKFLNHRSGNEELLIASNDFYCRFTDMNTLKYSYEYKDEKPINCASLRNDGRTLLVVGDSKKSKLIDTTSNVVIKEINEHYDYLFSCEWSPNGNYFVTGGQDKCTRLYDFRNMSHSLNVLSMNISSVRSMRFTEDNQYLAVAEQADYVHIYDAANGLFLREQVIDFFTEIAGIGFTPGDGNCLYISTVDTNYLHSSIINNYGAIMEFERCRYTMNDIFF
jgi:WD40 repeat protein